MGLRELHLAKNFIGDVGAIALGDGLRTNRALTKLYIWRNIIADAGAASLCSSLEHNVALQLLDLRWNKISVAGVDNLIATCWVSTPLFRHQLERDPSNCALIGRNEQTEL